VSLQDNLHTIAAVAGISLCFLAVSGLQALVLNSSVLRHPQQRHYEACKARVATLAEQTMSRLAALDKHAGPGELRSAALETLE
jgi:hypothetical protein